ncbi:MAG: gliding motility-associated ABC transporter substrate-binding protein GldG [Bernardetiaceae bacterium]
MLKPYVRPTETALELLAIFLGLVFLYLVGQKYFLRLDLTEEKRYTLNQATKNTLATLDQSLHIEIYLAGDLNADFKRLQKSIQEKIEEFGLYANKRITYTLTDPQQLVDDPERKQQFFQELARMGITPTQVTRQEEGKVVQALVFPGAAIRQGNKELGVLLLKGNKADTPEQQLQQSIENIEYELITAIQKLSRSARKSVAFVQDLQTLRPEDTYALRQALSQSYIVEQIKLSQDDPYAYDALILAQPKARLSEIERYRLDQYIMRGGKVLFFIDPIQMNLDSIAQGGTYAFGYDLNLEDMLFRYGVRLNLDLVQDQLLHGFITVNTGNFGNQSNLQNLPWVYHVILNRFAQHPVTRNLDAIYARFVSSMDTVKSPGITKTPLLFTSDYSRTRRCPTMVDINEIKQLGQNPDLFKQKNIPVAYLLEGAFRSVYEGRFPPREVDRSQYRPQGLPTRLLVCADGDLIRNELHPKTKKPMPLGYDPASGGMFSNLAFVENALAYLLDPEGVILSRNQQIKMRPLDTQRLTNEKIYWQSFNLILPLAFLAALAVLLFWWRRKKYGHITAPQRSDSEDTPVLNKENDDR